MPMLTKKKKKQVPHIRTIAGKRTEVGTDGVRGAVVMAPLGSVKPNPWNPNEMAPAMRASLRHGLKTDGWLASQALLIWGTDDRGKRRDVIIDGEQRHREALELGLERGPMVFLDGLAEADARALTIKMDQKRGKWREAGLAELIRSIEHSVTTDDLALDLGFSGDDIARLLAMPAIDLAGLANPPPAPTGPPVMANGMSATAIKMVQVFLTGEEHARFEDAVRKLAVRFKTKSVSDTVRDTVFAAAK